MQEILALPKFSCSMRISRKLESNLQWVATFEGCFDKIIKRFRTREIINYNGFDYGRFHVFIDSCLLFLHREKLNDVL